MTKKPGTAEIRGSHRDPLGTRTANPVPDKEYWVTVIVRPRSTVGVARLSDKQTEDRGRQPLARRRHLSLDQFRERHGADEEELARVQAWAGANGLAVHEVDAARRSVVLSGRAGALGTAFGTTLAIYEPARGEKYRGREGPLRVDREVAPVIEAVIGLDKRPLLRADNRPTAGESDDAASVAQTPYWPYEVAQMYDFPHWLDGSGQRIAIVALGGGYRQDDLKAYFEEILGLPQAPTIIDHSVNGVRNEPGQPGDEGKDREVALDVQVIGSIVPGAELHVYFAPADARGMVDAVTTAVFSDDRPAVISISFGHQEDFFTEWARTAMDEAFMAAAALGITVCVAAGDKGSADIDDMVDVQDRSARARVDSPASSPYVLACGGTTLTRKRDGRIHEVVWGRSGWATGGGVSEHYPVPAWQSRAGVPARAGTDGRTEDDFGRGVPDVAGNADWYTGYRTYPTRGGGEVVQGGTSAVAPRWAALVAQLNQHLGNQGLDPRAGYLNPLLYDGSIAGNCFRSVTEGTNGRYVARPGWDPCTGLGTPDGTRLLQALTGFA